MLLSPTEELSETHQAKMVAVEKQQENERRERERVFSDQFSEDIKNYKEQGHITSKFSYFRSYSTV